MTVRWIWSLLAAGAFCLALVAAVQTSEQVQLQQRFQERLERRYQNLTRWQKDHLALQSKVQEWNQLWQRVEQAGLVNMSWQRYPVQIQKTLHPPEATSLLQLLSNDVNAGTDFWFLPRLVQATPVLAGSGEENASQRPALQLQVQGQMLTSDNVAAKGGQ